MALRLAGSCEAATRRFVNDRLRVARLREAELIFEFVASGLLHVAARDAINAEAAKGYDLTRSDDDLTQSDDDCPLIVMMIAL
jgi:hypothetical protein